MTTKLEQAARQALEALEVYEIKLNSRLCNEAITALREALANTRSSIRSTSEYSEQAEHEPVAWKHDCAALCANDVELWIDNCPHCGKPRTAAPVRTKDLTDDEVMACRSSDPAGGSWLESARAVIAADREKNKPNNS